MQAISLRRALVTSLVATAALPAAAAPAAERLFTITPTGRLLTLQSDKPQAILAQVRVSGLEAGEEVVALDVRPATTSLFGLTNRSRVVQINPSSGQARPFATAFAPPLADEAAGFDFNPTVDRIRVVDSSDLNLRLNPDTGQTSNQDPALRYAADDPAAGANPNIVALAYTRPFPGAGETRLYGIDAARGTLVLQEPANAGTLRTVAPLTLRGRPLGPLVGPVSFDISESGRAFLAFRDDDDTRAATLSTVNVQTGNVNPLDFLGPQTGLLLRQGTLTQGLAAGGAVPDDERAPAVVFAAPANQRLVNVLRRGLRFEVSCSEACDIQGAVSLGGRVISRGAAISYAAGKGNLRFTLNRAAKRRILSSGRRRLVMRLLVSDFAGNRRIQSENVTLR